MPNVKNRAHRRSAPPAEVAADNKVPGLARTTLVLPAVLDQNLEAYALTKGLPKGEMIKMILTEFLIQQGLQPDKRPIIQVSY